MPQLRLIDPNGYLVPGTVTTATDDQVDAVKANLRTEAATQDADSWNEHGHQLSALDYRVQVTPDPLPTNPQALTALLPGLLAAEQNGGTQIVERLTAQLGDAGQARRLLADAYLVYAAQLRTAA